MRAVDIGGEANAVSDIDAQIVEMRAKIAKAFTSYRAACVEIQNETERWDQKFRALQNGSYRVLRLMVRACAFADRCQALADRLGCSAYICQDVEAVLAAQMLRSDDAIIVLDLVEPPSYRLRWDSLDGPLDPLVHALDWAASGLVSLADVVVVTSAGLGAVLQKAGLPATLMPDYPLPRPFATGPGVRQACRLGEAERLILFADRLDAGFANRAVVASLRHLPESYHIAIIGNPGDRYRRELVEYLTAQGLRARVHLLPPVAFARFPSFAGSADVAVIGLDPANAADRLALPASLFDCISARLPVATGNFPEIQQILCDYEAGTQFDRNEPQSIAASISFLTDTKARMLPNIDKAARELAWSRNEATLMTHLRGAGAVAMLRTERPVNEQRSRQIASTLLNHGVDLTIVTAHPKVENDNVDRPGAQIAGAKYIEIPVDN